MIKIKYKLLMAMTVILLNQQALLALPGDNISALIEWSEKNPCMTKLVKNSSKRSNSNPDYITNIIIHPDNNKLKYNVWLNKKNKVKKETFESDKDFDILKFLTEVYQNKAIADDYMHSRLINSTTKEHKDNNGNSLYLVYANYKGKLFNYKIITTQLHKTMKALDKYNVIQFSMLELE